MYLELVNVLQVIYIFLAVFGILLVRHIDRFSALSLLLALQAVLMAFNFLEETGVTRHYYLVTPIFTLGFGPAVYLFVRQLVYGHLPERRLLALHFLPMLAALAITHWPQLVIALGSISQAIYLTAAIFLVTRYHRLSFQTRSDAHAMKLNWLSVVLGIFLFMMLQDLIRLNLQPHAPLWLLKRWYLANIGVDFMLSAYLIYKAVRQPLLFEPLQAFEEMGVEEAPAEADEAADAEAEVVFSQIDQFIRDHKLYRQSRLSLRDLADGTGLGAKTISWAINKGAGKSFCDYINSLRLQAVRRELESPSHEKLKLLDLALDMGFGAKSTFNTLFKKETGLTPSEYMRRSEGNSGKKGSES